MEEVEEEEEVVEEEEEAVRVLLALLALQRNAIRRRHAAKLTPFPFHFHYPFSIFLKSLFFQQQ